MHDRDLLNKILLHLTEISRGELTMTAAEAVEPEDEDVQRILSGLVYLHEELKYREAANAARAAAEASSRAKSAFLTTMSHELRTPLNAILGYTELACEQLAEVCPDPVTKAVVTDLGHVERAARHLLSLVDDVLDLARVDAGHLVHTVGPLPLRSLLAETHQALEPLARDRGIELRTDAPEARVHSDRRLLLQCLLNLGANAIKFTEQGSVSIRARVTDTGFDLRVQDTGRGMTTEQTRRALEAFEQVHGNERTGTGLGLPITQRITRQLGGTLDIRSAPGEGTSILMRMPNLRP